jgi:hypothetical protein
MRTVRRFAVALIALALMCAAPARAQVLNSVPADALAVVKVKSLQDVSGKIAVLAQRWGLANMVQELNDPLGSLLAVANLGPGLDKAGEAAFAVMMPAAGPNAPEPDLLILIPVTDYKAFAGSLPNAKADGALTEFSLGNGNKGPRVAADWGKFAALSNNKDVLAKKPTGLKATGVSAKELDSKDLIGYANLKEIRKFVLPEFQKNKGKMLEGIERGMAQAPNANQKYAPVLKAYLGQFLNVAEAFLTDADGATFGVNLSKDGVQTSLVADFRPDSYAGKAMAQMKGSDASFTAGLPDAKYFFYGGLSSQGNVGLQLLNDFVAPIEKELNAMGAEGKGIVNYLDATREYMAATKQMTFGMVAPTANAIMAQEGIIQMVGVVKGDSAKLAAAQKKMMESQAALMEASGANAMGLKTTTTPGAKTVDGIKFDQYTTTFDMKPNTPQEQQMAMMLGFMYGAKGMNAYVGAIGADTTLNVVGGNDALLTAAIASAKAGDDPLGKGVASKVNAGLPQNRVAVFYLSLDTIASTVLDVMAMNGLPGGVKLPPNLPPLAGAIATEGSSLRMDGYIPAQTVESLISAGMQMYFKRQGGGAGQPGGL